MPLMKIGGELLIHGYTTVPPNYPSVTRLANSNFVVVWNGYVSANGVYAQIFSQTGTKLGSEFLVNTDVPNHAYGLISTTTLTNGNFVVAWAGKDSSGWGIYGQIFTPDGTKVGTSFLVNTYTTNDQINPSLTGLINGNFIATWDSSWQAAPGLDVYGQLFTATGAKSGSEFLVNTYTAGGQSSPAVAGLTNGNFVVTWQSDQGTFGSGIYAQLFTPAAVKIATEFLVNSYDIYNPYPKYPAIASLLNGNYVLTWQGYQSGIYGQGFTATGLKFGPEFVVNNETDYSPINPAMTGLTNGNFAVIWQSQNQDGSGYGIYGQLFTSTFVKLGPEFLVNTYTPNDQTYPSIASLTNGNLVTVWQSLKQDSSGLGVYSQIFYPYLGVTFLNQPIRYTEDTPSDFKSIIAPVNTPTITATLSLSNASLGSLSTSVSGSVNSFYDTATGTWQASGAVQDVNVLLSKVQFIPALHFTGNFNISIMVQDGTYTLEDRTVVIGPPTLLSNDTATFIYTEHDGPRTLDSSLTLYDENTNFVQAIIAITSGFTPNEDRLLLDFPGITSNYNNATGILTLSSGGNPDYWWWYFPSNSLSSYQSALQNIQYQNIANNNPNYTPRSISFTAQDSDGIWTKPFIKNISLLPDLTPPILEHNSLSLAQGAEVILTENDIAASDRYTPAPLLEFTVSNVKNGYFENTHTIGTNIDHFSQSEITNRNIRFIHNGKPEKPNYELKVYNLDGVNSAPSTATVAFTPTPPTNATDSNILRNSIIGSIFSGAAGLGLFAYKVYLDRKADKSFEKALSSEDTERISHHQTVIRPIAKHILNRIKIRGYFDYDIDNTSNTLVEAVVAIVDELKTIGINVDLPNLQVIDRNRLINQIAIQTKAKFMAKNQYTFYSSITGFFNAEVTPIQMKDGAKDIAAAVAKVLKNAPTAQLRVVLPNSENEIEMEEFANNSNYFKESSQFQQKNALLKQVIK